MDREELENLKLKLEIEKLRLPWYRNLETWKMILPSIVLIASLYFAYGRGWLDVEKSKLELNKDLLRIDIINFTREKETLLKQVDDSRTLATQAKEQVVLSQGKIDSLIRRRADLLGQIDSLTNLNGLTRGQLQKIRKEAAEDLSQMQQEVNVLTHELIHSRRVIDHLRVFSEGLKIQLEAKIEAENHHYNSFPWHGDRPAFVTPEEDSAMMK